MAKKTKHQRARYDGATVSASFDNALYTADKVALFKGADSLAITAALDPVVRKTVRDRARYIVANCPYGFSMLDTFVTHVVGPWVTVSFPRAGLDENIKAEIAEAFDAWAMKARLWQKVRTMLRAKVTDGESFVLLFTDTSLVDDDNDVTLNLRTVECDRVESWASAVTRDNEIDGIRFDSNGHPVAYRVLRYHPGDCRSIKTIQTRAGDWVKAEQVIHYFDTLRPEQVRGVSDFVSALDIPAYQKSYRSAVAETAINAASISGILHTDAVPECFDDYDQSIGKCATEVRPNTLFQIRRGSFLTIPEGWSATQMRAEQPTSLYPDFVRALTAEMAACLCMPVNIAMCDSSQHNFASAKLDHMTYGDKIGITRSTLATEVLDRIFFAWLEEYATTHEISRQALASLRKTEWLFTERGNSEVMKDASADNTRLSNGTTTRATIYAKDGKDWKRETDQAIDEAAYIMKAWRDKCIANGLPEDTPCPFVPRSGMASSQAPTEDMVEHDAQKNAAPRRKTKTAKKPATED